MLSHILQTEGSSMLEAISSFAQAIANTLLLSSHGEAELLLGLVVGLAFVLDLARGRDIEEHGADLDLHPRPPARRC
jgi:hypothetical protein